MSISNSTSSGTKVLALPTAVSRNVSHGDFYPVIYTRETGCTLEVASSISAMFRGVYGVSYHAAIIDEDTGGSFIQSQIESGAWIACICRDADGRVVAHGALLPNGGGWRIARILVDEGAKGCGSKITDELLRFADKSLGGRASVIAESVTSHGGSQKIFEDRGFLPLSLLGSKFLDYFGTGNRESVLVMGRGVSTTAGAVYVPDAVAPIVREMLTWHDLTTEVRGHQDGCGTELPADSSSIHLSSFDPHMELGRIALGAGALPADYLVEREVMFAKDPAFVELKIEVATPTGYALTQQALADGFIGAGIEPHHDGVWLLLQYAREGSGESIKAVSFEKPRLSDEHKQRAIRLKSLIMQSIDGSRL